MSIEQRVTAADGTGLLTRYWPAFATDDSDGPWAHVLIVHGLGEHSGRYEQVGAQFSAAGCAVHAYDHRGNGASDGRRGHVDRWSRLHDDLADRHGSVRAAAGGRPVVFYGHSLGGLVVAGYCLSARPRPDAVVLSSPGLDSTLSAWKKGLAAGLGQWLPRVPIPNGVDPSTLSRDPAVGERMAADPLCATTSTLGFGAEGLREQARVRAAAGRGLGVPTLVLHGEDDGLVPVDATAVFEGAPDTTRRTFPGLRHELHNEPEGPAIVAEIIDWLRDRMSPGPRAPHPGARRTA
jgi:alpha-beta hydrolase superfamily lysophospholipase